MFDILCDVWAKPGAVHSPIIPLDISLLTAESAEAKLSEMHKWGFDAVILTSGGEVDSATLEAAFKAAAKRYMHVFVSEDVILKDVGGTDEAYREYNPMMCAHSISASADGDAAAVLFVKRDGDKITEVTSEAAEDAEQLTLALTECPCGIDLLSPEVGEALVYGAYQSFLDKYREVAGGAFSGVVTSRLHEYALPTVRWSYDMAEEFYGLGGKPAELLSLVCDVDKRSRKEGERIYRKTVSRRLDRCYLTPLSEWCGKNSLALLGEVPYDFVGLCSRRFTMPIYADECFDGAVTNERERMIAVKCLADTARGEGFTGAAVKCTSSTVADLSREVSLVAAASASHVILPEAFADTVSLEEKGVCRDDVKKLLTRFRRLSTLNTSCSSRASTAILFEDGFIPFTGAERMKEKGAAYSFLSVSQAMDRGRCEGAEFLVDRFRFSTILLEPRVRMEPDEIRHIGEFAVYGGNLYRGAQFGEYAKKHLAMSELEKENYKSLLISNSVKCGHDFVYITNPADETVVVKYPCTTDRAAYLMCSDSGKATRLNRTPDRAEYEPIRLLPGGSLVIAFNRDEADTTEGAEPKRVREIHALPKGESSLSFSFADGDSAVIEMDSADGSYVQLSVNGETFTRLIAAPYTADVSEAVTAGECTIGIESDGRVVGAVLRLM